MPSFDPTNGAQCTVVGRLALHVPITTVDPRDDGSVQPGNEGVLLDLEKVTMMIRHEPPGMTEIIIRQLGMDVSIEGASSLLLERVFCLETPQDLYIRAYMNVGIFISTEELHGSDEHDAEAPTAPGTGSEGGGAT